MLCVKNIIQREATMLPATIAGSEYFILKFSIPASIDPVHTPVPGSGIATNIKSAR